VQQSVSYVYADQGEDWVVEGSPLCVTTATEPASVGEMAVQDFSALCRVGVVLRMGLVIGASPLTQWAMRAAAHGRPIGLGSPEGFIHLLHSDDVASAVHAALGATSGVYNVGAVPVRRREFVDGCAAAVGRDHGTFLGPVSARLRGNRLEPLGRSLRVSSAHFTEVTGWTPHRDRFDVSWFDAAAAGRAVLR